MDGQNQGVKRVVADYWKNISTTLLGVVVAGIGIWLVIGKDAATRHDLSILRTEFQQEMVRTKVDLLEYVKNQSPYSQDRGIINQQISGNASAIKELKDSVSQLVKTETALTVKHEVMMERLSNLTDDLNVFLRSHEKEQEAK